MIISKLLTNYILVPNWIRIFIFLCLYFIILSISMNEIIYCEDNIIVYKKKTMVLIEHDRVREYEDTIKAQEEIIKFEKETNKAAKVIVGTQILLIVIIMVVVSISSLAK